MSYDSFDITQDENGDLVLTLADSEDRKDLEEALLRSSYWLTSAELFEPYSCNGSYTHFDAGDGNPMVGLTSAPCIAESMSYEDNGDRTIDGKFWYFDNHMIENDLRTLAFDGTVKYTLAR